MLGDRVHDSSLWESPPTHQYNIYNDVEYMWLFCFLCGELIYGFKWMMCHVYLFLEFLDPLGESSSGSTFEVRSLRTVFFFPGKYQDGVHFWRNLTQLYDIYDIIIKTCFFVYMNGIPIRSSISKHSRYYFADCQVTFFHDFSWKLPSQLRLKLRVRILGTQRFPPRLVGKRSFSWKNKLGRWFCLVSYRV